MAESGILDSAWLRDHPLPPIARETDKNARGRVMAIGGSRVVPGGLLLTAEAALRAGAGKVQLATVRSIAVATGIAMPEAAVFALDETEDGEVAVLDLEERALTSCDTLVIGPGMRSGEAAGRVIDRVLLSTDEQMPVVIDAAALMSLSSRTAVLARRAGICVLTPHAGEMAALLESPAAQIEADPPRAALLAARRYHAFVALKGPTTVIASPQGEIHSYGGGGSGLATSGSGDVLAGIVAGLLARGAPGLHAAMWGIWLHGEAGRRAAEQIGPVGFLARELLAIIPSLAHSLR